jgi:hypothetical protein
LAITAQAPAQRLISFDAPGAGSGPYQGTEAAAINDERTITGTRCGPALMF